MTGCFGWRKPLKTATQQAFPAATTPDSISRSFGTTRSAGAPYGSLLKFKPRVIHASSRQFLDHRLYGEERLDRQRHAHYAIEQTVQLTPVHL